MTFQMERGFAVIPLRKGLTVLLLGALLFSAGAYHAVSAAPSFTAESGLRFTFPLPGDNANIVSFLLFSTEGDVAKTTAQVRQVKSPDGGILSLEAAQTPSDLGTVTPKGVKVSITLDSKYFLTPGDYVITVFFQGETGTPNLSTTVVINRPAPDINVDELKDQTVWLTRWIPLPFWSASDETVFHMRETTGKVPLNDFKVVGQSIYVKDTKELVPGEVTVTPLPDDPPAGAGIGAGAAKRLNVALSHLGYAGAFDTRLLVTSPSFTAGKTIPVKVNVQDLFFFPLLAIALGVVGGFITRRLVSVERPRNANSFQILRLQREVERFRELVSKPANVATIQSLLAQLSNAKDSNETGDFAAVRAELPKIESALEEFRKAQVQAEGEVQTSLNNLRNQVDLLVQSNTLTAEEASSIKDQLADIERLLRLGMIDDAQTKIENSRQRLEDLRRRKFTDYFALLKAEVAALTLNADAIARRSTLEAEIQALLNSNDLDKVRLKLEDFKRFVEEQKAANSVLGARENFDAGLPQVPADPVPAGPFTHLQTTTPPDSRIVGEIINFEVVDSENIVDQTVPLRWFFGEVGFVENKGLTASHPYQNSGRFQVRVEVTTRAGVKKELTDTITIAPGELEKARAGVLQNIVRNERILSLIALILAIISGLLFLYIGKPFGSLTDYLLAILWGFGIDNSVKGFAAVLSKISSPEA